MKINSSFTREFGREIRTGVVSQMVTFTFGNLSMSGAIEPGIAAKRNVLWTPQSTVTPAAVPLLAGAMMGDLLQVEKDLPLLLSRPGDWKTLLVNHEKPYVERVYKQVGPNLYASLHILHPCSPDESLPHPHPWPSAMRIVAGNYIMGVGYGTGTAEPPFGTMVYLAPGSAYEMVDPDAWHYVQPTEVSCSVMVTRGKWNRTAPANPAPLGPLTDDRKIEIIEFFRQVYVQGQRPAYGFPPPRSPSTEELAGI